MRNRSHQIEIRVSVAGRILKIEDSVQGFINVLADSILRFHIIGDFSAMKPAGKMPFD
jgi:hypothetical protein